MPIPKKPFKLTRNLFRRIRKLYDVTVKALANSVLRTLHRRGRRPYRVNAGFALPTTMMVLLVVILLTTAMVFRSFDRNRNAILSRSEQVIQNTSTPALDRARAKIAELLADPNLPRGTPPDTTLLQVVTDAKYTFNDETRLKLAFDLDKSGSIDSVSTNPTLDPKKDETLNTAWKYPVDTDGNGKFDAFTLYGIYWRSPNFGTGGQSNQYARGRTPLEARSLPQDSAGLSGACASAGLSAATSIAQGDWLTQGSNLSKAFYVYAATVPITSLNGSDFSPGPFPNPQQQFEVNKRKDKAFSGLEYEQDRYRQGLNNNAVLYQNDLIMNPGSTFRLNGKIVSNSNLLVGGPTSDIELFQVSSIHSCFYEEENGLITVGGNVGTGEVSQSTDQQPTKVNLFQGKDNPTKQDSISGQNRSTNSPGGSQIAYNDAAYTKRIGLMKQTALSFCNCDGDTKKPTAQSLANIPQYTNDAAFQKSLQEALAQDSGVNNPYDTLAKQIEIYLRNRTRGVPYAEVPAADAATALGAFAPPTGQEINTSVFSQGIEPPDVWSIPLDANTKLSLDINNLPQNNPSKRQNNPIENLLGDRVNVGNNLPAYWKKNGKYVGAEGQQDIGSKWADDNTARYRTTQVQPIDDLGETDRGGYWEKAAALNPNPPKNSNAPSNAGGGGLRVITGAGIYVDGDTPTTAGAAYPRLVPPAGPFRDAQTSFLPVPSWDTRFVDPNGTDPNRIHPADLQFNAQPNILVWSDLMPMTGGLQPAPAAANTPETRNGDLLMRATAVYHYIDGATASPNISQTPIACVSSYYNPTDQETARNLRRLSSDVSGGLDTNGDGSIDKLFDNSAAGSTPAGAKSNNGVVYAYPGRSLGRYYTTLMRQASLVFPNGRVVNPPLREAMRKRRAAEALTLADYSALDTAICAIAILENNAGRSTVIPDGAIKESAFLDGREVKEVDRLTPNDPNYDSTKLSNNLDLPLELRQPLEIRVTDINLGLLAKTKHSTFDTNGDGKAEQEYLLPNSGIIYASRDDAFSDSSDSSAQGDLYSPIDFKLDPTRRPNGIRLTNGLSLERERDYRVEEKGLILATNLPGYVKGHFNLHLQSGTTTFTSGNPELEEFQQTLNSNWSNFDARQATDVERKFACRYDPAQPRKCPSPGDQWRPATIIADAVTLQSGTFKDGYRNQGDFDLRNNAGSAASIPNPATPTVINTVAGNRANNGFFDNSFVTTANWWQGTGFPKATTPSSQVSYLLNGVTPIQRRANVYAYPTETCRVIPVSQCTAKDWQIDSLDTSKATSVVADQRYARRVAFVRDPTTQASYYYDPDGYPQLKLTTTPPPKLNNALWFAMRDDTSGQLTYDATSHSQPFIFQPLYPADYPVARLRGQPQIPDLKWLRGYAAASPTKSAPLKTTLGPTRSVSLVSGYPPPPTSLAFTPPNSSQDFTTVPSIFTYVFNTQFGAFSFPATKRFNISLGTNQPYLNFGVEDPNNRTVDLTGGGKMRVFSATNNLTLSNSSGLTLTGDAGSVFVIHVRGNLTLTGNKAVQLQGGVVPDNIYWLVEDAVNVNRLGLNPGILPGNVLARGAITVIGNSQIEGRALSLTSVSLSNAASKIIPPAGNQPRLVPVNQIQSANGTPAISTTTPRPGDDTKYPANWLQQAESTNYNAAFVVGDSPTRVDEQSGGLNNLVRLQESWSGQTLTIKGSFIESKRSSTATGPFSPIRRSVAGIASAAGVNPLSLFDKNTLNRYWTDSGTPRGTLPYYSGATRQWGFDVGLLSQSPDLFSQRFTKDIPRTGNYYRQVGRDDSWIETLLCAAEPADPTNADQRVGKTGTSYTRPAVPTSERPDCKNVTNFSNISYPPN